MTRTKPAKDDITAALRRIATSSPDGCASQRVFQDETGWDRYWFDRYWPDGGYRAACDEAGVRPGAKFGVDFNIRVTDDEVAIRFADAVARIGRIPYLKQFAALAQIGTQTICRGELYKDAKRRMIAAYLELPEQHRKGEEVDGLLRDELRRLDNREDSATALTPVAASRHSIEVPTDYVSLVREFRERGEEEKRQLVAQFFHSVLGYKRARVRSEHKHNDVRVNDRRDKAWLVVEVKAKLEAERERRAARRQGFDYAHRHGMRFVVISDADFYEIYDRCLGDRLRYDEMRQGSFRLTALRIRDSDLLSMLAAER